mgnify:CR=1 FL=1
MSTLSRPAHHRLKAAQRDLIQLAGGIERAGEITSYGKSTVGRWNSATDPDLMPLAAIVALEADCGMPLVTAVLADLAGRRLSDPEGRGEAAPKVFARHAEAMQRAGELMAAGAQAFADGRVTPAEMQMLGTVAGEVQKAIADLQAALAHGKAEGGEVIAFGRAGE